MAGGWFSASEEAPLHPAEMSTSPENARLSSSDGTCLLPSKCSKVSSNVSNGKEDPPLEGHPCKREKTPSSPGRIAFGPPPQHEEAPKPKSSHDKYWRSEAQKLLSASVSVLEEEEKPIRPIFVKAREGLHAAEQKLHVFMETQGFPKYEGLNASIRNAHPSVQNMQKVEADDSSLETFVRNTVANASFTPCPLKPEYDGGVPKLGKDESRILRILKRGKRQRN